jgi:hypothetical protein
MTSTASFKKKYAHFISDFIYYLLFGIISFYVIYKAYNPEILYFKLQPFFSLDPAYIEYHFQEQLGYISLVSQFLLQLLYYPVAGSLVLSFFLVIFALEYRFIFSKRINSLGRGFELIPPLIILVSLKNYSTTLDGLILFFVTGLFVIGNRLFNTDRLILKIVFQLICIYLFFSVLGLLPAFALLVFFIVDEIIVSRTHLRFISILLNITFLSLLVFAYLGFTLSLRLFQTTFSTKLYTTVPSYWYLLVFHVIGIVLTLILSIEAFSKVTGKTPGKIAKKWAIPLALLILGIIFSKKLFINEAKYNAQIEFYASEKSWNKVLQLKNKTKLEDRVSRFLLNRALYETGQMANNLFSIPQDGGEYTLLLTKTFTHECTMYSSDLFYDMGFVKGANYWAIEAQTFGPYSPRVLQRLAITTSLLEEYAASEKYFKILKRSFIYNSWASELLKMAHQKNYTGLKRALNSKNIFNSDIFFLDNENPSHILIDILKNDPKNIMAFEYLESFYLMRNDLGDFYSKLSFMTNMAYQTIPKVFQEALIIYYLKNNIPEDKFYYPIDLEIQNNFISFNKVLLEYRKNPELAKYALQKEFGNTYWYYLRYGSPMTIGKSLKKRKI